MSVTRQSIATTVSNSDVRDSITKGAHLGKDNLLLANCDAWSKVHCHQVPASRQSRMSIKEIAGSRTTFRSRSSSTRRSLSQSSCSQKQDVEYMKKHRRSSRHQRLVCKNGPNCKNHDWDQKSPIRKVCTRDEKCPNHDWSNVDKRDSPFRVVCVKGPGCKNHNWNKRSPMQREKRVRKFNTIQQSAPSAAPQQPQQKASSNDGCMLHMNERHFQQQMATMRTMQEDHFRMLELLMQQQQT